jgi:hypothetical protein
MMEKVDFKKAMRELYTAPKGKFKRIEVPEMQYLMIDGRGDPGSSQAYQDAIEALYALAYRIKFMSKNELESDYVVPPLEGLWGSEMMVSELWEAEDEEEWLRIFHASDRDAWSWTMMIMLPDWIGEDLFESALQDTRDSKDLPALDKLRVEPLEEGLCVQTLHLGPYIEEGPILARMHVRYLPSEGLIENGKHHEVYLSDPRRVAPEKIKTLLRQPVRELKK